MNQQYEDVLTVFDGMQHELKIFMSNVSGWISTHPILTEGAMPAIHSVKSRVKNREHLREKLIRKAAENKDITSANLGDLVTDLTGVRVLHLYQEQFSIIHDAIMTKVNQGDWYLNEKPMAYTWDPESERYFLTFDLNVQRKESSYTSVHYVVRPKEGSKLSCEIQVRTLFEEIWGEVDHILNYPRPSESIASREQLLVLAKVVGAGSRLVDSIFRTATPPLVRADHSQSIKPLEQPSSIDQLSDGISAPVVPPPPTMGYDPGIAEVTTAQS